MHIKQSKKKKEKSGEFFESFVCVFIFDSGDFGLDWKRVLIVVRTFYEGGFLIVFCLLAAGEEKETRS